MGDETVSAETEISAPEAVTAETESVTPSEEAIIEEIEAEEVSTELDAEIDGAEGTGEVETETPAEASEESQESEAEGQEVTPETPREVLEAELKRARKEAAANREKARTANEKLQGLSQAFEGADEEFQQGWLELAKRFTADPNDPEVQEIFAALAGTAPEAPALDENVLFEKVRAQFEQGQAVLAQERIQNELILKAESLGFKPSADPETEPTEFARNRALWSLVAAQPEGERDLETANAALEAYEQAVFDRKLAELSAKNKGVPVTRGSGIVDTQKPEKSSDRIPASQKLKQAREESIRLAEEQASRPRY